MSRRTKRNIVINDSSRAFINTNNALCTEFIFYSCIGMDGLVFARDETQKIYCPDPNRYDKFITSARITGRQQDATTAIKTYLPKNDNSLLLFLYNSDCTFDMQVHFGSCGLPDTFENFERLLMLQDVEVTGYTTDTIIAINSSERAPIIETADIRIETSYELLHQNLITITDSIPTSGINLSASVFDGQGTCLCPNSNAVYSTQLRENFDGTLAELFIVDTIDGVNWSETQVTDCGELDINQLVYSKSVLSDSGTIVCLPYLDEHSGLLNTILQFDNTIYTGLSNIYDYVNKGITLYTVGNSGIILETNIQSKITRQFIDATLPVEDLYSIDTFEGTDSLLVGGGNGLLFLLNKETQAFTTLTPVVDGVAITTGITNVQYLDENTLIFTTVDGINAKSCDGGTTWGAMGKLNGCISAIKFHDKFVGYAVGADTNGVNFYRTINSGSTWSKLVHGFNLIGLSLDHVITDISISQDKPDNVAFVGKLNSTALTPLQICDRTSVWDAPNDTGVLIKFIK